MTRKNAGDWPLFAVLLVMQACLIVTGASIGAAIVQAVTQ